MIRYDDLMNGSAANPSYASATPTAPLPTSPAGGATDLAAVGKLSENPRTVLLVWFILLALLVVSHVVTLSVQK